MESEVSGLQAARYITITSNRRKMVLDISTILYVVMIGKSVEIHVSGGDIYETRITLSQLEEELGENFIKIHRGCIVWVVQTKS